MGLSPSSVLILSITSATRPRFVMTIGIGVLSSPSRAAVSEKENSSNVKCSEIFMGFCVQLTKSLTANTSPRRRSWNCAGGQLLDVLSAPASGPPAQHPCHTGLTPLRNHHHYVCFARRL